MLNRATISHNPLQGEFKKVLCVCNTGLISSATASVVLSNAPFFFNTRPVGITSFSLVRVDDVLLSWCDEVVCLSKDHAYQIKDITDKPVVCLNLEENFVYRDPKYMEIIKSKYLELTSNA